MVVLSQPTKMTHRYSKKSEGWGVGSSNNGSHPQAPSQTQSKDEVENPNQPVYKRVGYRRCLQTGTEKSHCSRDFRITLVGFVPDGGHSRSDAG